MTRKYTVVAKNVNVIVDNLHYCSGTLSLSLDENKVPYQGSLYIEHSVPVSYLQDRIANEVQLFISVYAENIQRLRAKGIVVLAPYSGEAQLALESIMRVGRQEIKDVNSVADTH